MGKITKRILANIFFFLLIFQSLRFRIEIITQNRKFCKSFDKIAAFVTKIDYVPCFFCASFPEKAADIPVSSP